jgi:glycosyltransferase involved in cell wall biosynthesis
MPEDVPTPFGKDARLRLAIVGRVAPSKGQFDAVKALHEVREHGIAAELLIVGTKGPAEYWREIEQYCQQHELQKYVHYVGFQDNPASYLKHADAALVCSANEAYGRVTVEAMTQGKAVVAAASGGSIEVVQDGKTGLLYEAQDVQALAKQIELLAKPQFRKEIATAGQRAAGQMATDYTAAYLAYVKQAVSGRRHAAKAAVLAKDLLAGAWDQRLAVEQKQAELVQTHNEELQKFSDDYNRVYEAYNTVSRELESLNRTKTMRVRRKLAGIKRKLSRD